MNFFRLVMNQLKIENLEFIESVSIKNNHVKGATGFFDIDLDVDLDAALDVALSNFGLISLASGSVATALAFSEGGKAEALALADADVQT